MNRQRKKPPTRDDVARLAGVSSAVVSYVVNNGPRPVAKETKERVLEAMHSLNYQPNAAARAIRTGRTNIICLLVPDIANPFFAELAKITQNDASQRGYTLTIADTEGNPDKEATQIHSLAAQRPDGALVIGRTPEATLTPLIEMDIPVVALDHLDHDRDISTVSINNYQGALEGLEHLRQHGHTNIAFIGGPADTPAANARYQAWKDTLGSSAIDTKLAVTAPFSRQGGYAAAQTLLRSKASFSALLSSSDVQAIGAMHAFIQHGIDVPSQCAVLSFDGTEESAYSNPSLSVIQQPLQIMASSALDLLLNPKHTNSHQIVPHTLVRRASCGCTVDPPRIDI